MATPSGFEPPISTLTGWRVRPLHHGAGSLSLRIDVISGNRAAVSVGTGSVYCGPKARAAPPEVQSWRVVRAVVLKALVETSAVAVRCRGDAARSAVAVRGSVTMRQRRPPARRKRQPQVLSSVVAQRQCLCGRSDGHVRVKSDAVARGRLRIDVYADAWRRLISATCVGT